MDYLVAVGCIQGQNRGIIVGSRLVRCIKKLMNENWLVKVNHVYREANKSANFLANLRCEIRMSQEIYDVPPANLGQVLLADSMRVSFNFVVILFGPYPPFYKKMVFSVQFNMRVDIAYTN